MPTSLQLLAMEAQARPQHLATTADALGIDLEDGEVVVIVEPTSGRATRVDEAAVRALGGSVEARSDSLLRVRAPAERLFDLADRVSGVAYIREPYDARPVAVTSEGVSVSGASDFHTAGYYGQGTKVAIIDLGFSGYTAARNAGELDNVVFTYDYTGDGFETYTVHGTGVAEIVADMAPQAELYLMMVGDSVDLQNALDDCVARGVQVINHSVAWFNSNFYDGTGTIANIANDARSQGILWVNAAGNYAAGGHWQGEFVDSDNGGVGDGYLDFATPGTDQDFVDADGRDEGNEIYAAAGKQIRVYMTWNDWAVRTQNYDLHLYNSAGTKVASSTNLHTGWQQPTERIVYDVPTSGDYEIVVESVNAPDAPEIEFFVFVDSASPALEHQVARSSVAAPANSEHVFTVGAISQANWTPGPAESFSSRGPSNDSVYTASIKKPDIAGPDAVSGYTYGFRGFGGTSAASPHVAGAAALLLSENSALTAAGLQTKLEADAIDMGDAGKDDTYGWGRLDLEPTPLDPLRGHWALDEGSGASAGDSSGNGNDGTIHGEASYAAGQSGTGLSFDGTNDYVAIPDDVTLDVTGDLSIEFWMRSDGIGDAFQVLVSKRSDSDWTGPYQVWLDNRASRGMSMAIRFVLGAGTASRVLTANSAIVSGQRTHVVATVTGTTTRIYVDGVEQASGTFTGTRQTNGAPVKLGVYPHGGGNAGRYFDGMLDEVKIHAEAIVPTPPAPPALEITTTTLANGQEGRSYSETVAATGGTLPYTWSAAGLPTGLSINENTGAITGTPAEGTAGDHAVMVMVTDAVTATDDQEYTLTIDPAGSNLVGEWQLDEGSGSTAGDSSGYGNDGVIYGASWVAGHSSTGLSFDGTNDYVEIPDDATLDVAGDLSIEFWVRSDEIGDTFQCLVSKRWDSDWTAPYQVWLDNRSSRGMSMAIRFVLGAGTASKILTANNALVAGEWAHVVATVTGTTTRIYVDGVEEASGTYSGTRQANDAPVKLGVYPNGGGNYGFWFDGALDEVKIHAEAIVPAPAAVSSALALKAVGAVVRVVPNPVTQSARFEAPDSSVVEIWVQVYDLARNLVFDSGWVDGDSILWDSRNDAGEELANGPYLYVAWTKDSGGAVRANGVGKLFLSRH